MIREEGVARRNPETRELQADLVIVGGGLAGTCAAITAAREGVKVVLVQDRPVLGGNSSSEVRLWVLGATSHMGNNNRWAREGGVINEILEENLYRNREGNPLLFDTVLLEKVVEEQNITLLLNTAVYDLEKSDPDTISELHAFCSQNSTRYVLRAPLYCDSSGDGIVGFLAGAAFRMGAESRDEFDEKFAPDESYGELLGHSMYFYSKDVGVPVKFVPPSWALKDITTIPRYRQFNTNMQGCQFWWMEYGGRLDTVHETETIKWELWKVIYGVWDYFKNSGRFPEAETMTLEWVGHVPGKRESRRFEGDYIINQNDLVEQRDFEDVVAHGGWAIDLHPADGIYSPDSPCQQWHNKGVYGIPYRCYYSRNITNLFLAGRIISASHVAFGSTRVMASCAAGAQAVAMAAAVCREEQCLPRDITSPERMATLQRRLQRAGQFLPGRDVEDGEDLAREAKVAATSSFQLSELRTNRAWVGLDHGWAVLLPFEAGPCPKVVFEIQSNQSGALRVELCRSSKVGNFTPDEVIEALELPFGEGTAALEAEFLSPIERGGYHFIKLCEDPAVRVRVSDDRVTGVLALSNAFNKSVATSSLQQPPPDSGLDTFEFWLPKRRPEGRNLAVKIDPPIESFGAANVTSGPARPSATVNAWVAAADDERPELRLNWSEQVEINRIILELDPDWDHPMESVLMSHPEEAGPFLLRDFDLVDGDGEVVASIRDNHNGRLDLRLAKPLPTKSLALRVLVTHGAPAAVFRVRCYS